MKLIEEIIYDHKTAEPEVNTLWKWYRQSLIAESGSLLLHCSLHQPPHPQSFARKE